MAVFNLLRLPGHSPEKIPFAPSSLVNWYPVRIQLNFTKPPQASKPPSLNWRSQSAPLSFTPECEAGLEALNVNADHEKVTIADASTALEVRHNGIDVTLAFFRDLLSEKPVQGADAIHGLAGWSEGSAGEVGKGKKRANTTLGRGGRKNRILAASV
ncbi:hypothetical protein B0H14DRAFT_2588871 [Mycena olivaceomarginata]|nr:hypothetical protein B0H14DRAFT_2588871 [Mycena olivaceomarginata]